MLLVLVCFTWEPKVIPKRPSLPSDTEFTDDDPKDSTLVMDSKDNERWWWKRWYYELNELTTTMSHSSQLLSWRPPQGAQRGQQPTIRREARPAVQVDAAAGGTALLPAAVAVAATALLVLMLLLLRLLALHALLLLQLLLAALSHPGTTAAAFTATATAPSPAGASVLCAVSTMGHNSAPTCILGNTVKSAP